jgi:hypothetical protein
LTIDTGGPRPPVAFRPLPRDEQRRGVVDQVEQIAEASRSSCGSGGCIPSKGRIARSRPRGWPAAS